MVVRFDSGVACLQGCLVIGWPRQTACRAGLPPFKLCMLSTGKFFLGRFNDRGWRLQHSCVQPSADVKQWHAWLCRELCTDPESSIPIVCRHAMTGGEQAEHEVMAGVNTGNPGPEASIQHEAPGSSQRLPSAQELALIEEARAVQERQKRKAEKKDKKRVSLHDQCCAAGRLLVLEGFPHMCRQRKRSPSTKRSVTNVETTVKRDRTNDSSTELVNGRPVKPRTNL